MQETPVTALLVATNLPVPGPADHKYTRGVVHLITGSAQYPGAGVLSVGGATYGGAGMVHFGGSERAANLVLAQFPEVVLTGDRSDALVIGSGWGNDLRPAVETALSTHTGPVVVDAGALTLPLSWRSGAPLTVLTPHPGEARRLWDQLGLTGDYPELAQGMAHALAAATGAIIVLKGATTVVSDHRVTLSYRARTAWPGVAGAGDVLAGVIGSALARRWKLGGTPDWVETVAAAVWLHGEAGALASGVGGDTTHPIRAGDIIKWLPAAWAKLPR